MEKMHLRRTDNDIQSEHHDDTYWYEQWVLECQM